MFTRYSDNLPNNYSGNAFRQDIEFEPKPQRREVPRYENQTRLAHSPLFPRARESRNEPIETYFNDMNNQEQESVRESETPTEQSSEDTEILENFNDAKEATDNEEKAEQPQEPIPEKAEEHKPKNFLSDIKTSSLWNALSKAGSDEMLLAGLILLLSGSERNSQNDDIIMILALLLLK